MIFRIAQTLEHQTCQHILHGPLGNLLAWYACKALTLPTAEGVDDAVEASMGGSLVGGGGGVI